MRLAASALILLALAACMPQGPTGNAIAPPTHWVNGNQILLETEPLATHVGAVPVRITVRGDIVSEEIRIDGKPYTLVGEPAGDGWLRNEGVALLRLDPGAHVAQGYSCFETLTGWKCGCRREGDCGHWMERAFRVERHPDETFRYRQ